jgi:oligopeptide transport system substrate-binding protein
MKVKGRWLAALGVITALALVVGCGKKSATVCAKLGAEQEMTIAWGAEPPSLDPGLATDTTSSNVLLNIMDPLIKLGPAPDLKPVPSLAESWDENGNVVTFHLRQDGRWTNGDPVTAQDFEYSWKRTASPELGADYAYQFFGIKGAAEYNSCDPKTGKDAKAKKACDSAALRDAMGVKALDKYTLQVTLTSVQPWFVQQVAHSSFLAVNRKTVERWGDKWTDPAHIVTDGPFTLADWKHNASIDLVKNDKWRNAKDVALKKVCGKIIVEGTTRVQAFEAGEVDALDGGALPPAEMSRLKQMPEYEAYPALGTYYYGFNVKKISDVNQRKAMAIAIPRQMIIDKITQDGRKPATSLTPMGMPGYETIKQDFLPVNGDMKRAKQYMAKVANPVKNIALYYDNSPGHREIAVTIQAAWSQLGIKTTIKQMEWAQFLEFLGPPPNNAVDVFRNGWVGDYVDDINFLDLMTCTSGNNNTNWCNKSFDALVAQAEKTPNNAERYKIYAKAEAIMTGKDGDIPITPITWYTYPNLEKLLVKDTFNINLLDQFDLTKVKVKGTS